MLSVIDFLERLGGEAQLRYAADGDVEQALIDAQMQPTIRSVILSRDSRLLEALLQTRANLVCLVHSPEDEEEETEDDDQEDSDDDGGGKEDKATSDSADRCVAATN
ncbi:MAG: hypothetical protein ACREV5_15405 [Steroidobacter sp.]